LLVGVQLFEVGSYAALTRRRINMCMKLPPAPALHGGDNTVQGAGRTISRYKYLVEGLGRRGYNLSS